jgi:formylglycine-generating enzyme required for sulfatase activity
MTRTKNDTTSRVLRGGSWNNVEPWWVRATSRYTVGPANRNDLIGFRTSLAGKMKR